jgi:23S rRNA (uracil1939-C5)-methyltransferase
VTILTGSVGTILEQIKKEKSYPLPDLVMVDPPRAGLDSAALQLLIDLSARQIIYVSCNPATQAQNVEVLLQAGYRLKSIQPVDQFPHTIHIENIILLEK